MSIMSRKAIEEFVEQDHDFVVYRYPSQSQPVDLIRRGLDFIRLTVSPCLLTKTIPLTPLYDEST